MTRQALLFADVVDSTQLGERLGDLRAAALWAEHDRQARALLARHQGREIDRADGFFLLFDDVVGAAHFALGYHEVLAALGLTARVGLHAGEVVLRENAAADVARGAKPLEVDGRAKPLAARVMALARGGQTLLSDDARQALGAAPEGCEFESHGHWRLKGVEAPVEIFELGRAGGAFEPPADAPKAWRVLREGDLWRPLRDVRHNLVAERDAFVGRREVLRALSQRLDDGARLLTVLGPGGVGKTRLARRYALAWRGDWPGGVYFCDLSEARTPEGLCWAVSVGLEVPLDQDPVTRLGHAIAGRGRCLVVLDNFEQVAAHAAATLGRWLDRAPEAAFLVTSRERLRLAGEQGFVLDPLALEHEAMELFETRARALPGGFVADEAARADIARLVRLLDGLPLAIELAAARAGVLSPAQLLARLGDRFRILAGAAGMGGAAARQATLRAAIDWSWDLLAPWEQAALAQCAVFDGGFRLEAAEAVVDLSPWPEAPPVMDVVQALVDKSLLRAWRPLDPRGAELDEPRFGMYLSIQDYAAQRLSTMDAAVGQGARERHARYFAGFGSDEAANALGRHGGARRRHALALDFDNLVAACRRAVAAGQAHAAVHACRAVWLVVDLRGPYRLVMELGDAVLAVAEGDPLLCALALRVRAAGARRAGRVDEAAAGLQRSLALARAAGDRRAEAFALGDLGSVYVGQGRDEEIAFCEQALAMHREAGDRMAEGLELGNLGTMFCDRGRIDDAERCYQAALEIHRATGNRRAECTALVNLGTLCSDIGRTAEANRHYPAALEIARELGDRRAEGVALGNLGTLLFVEGRAEEALQCTEGALAIAREVGDRRSEGISVGNRGDMLHAMGRLAEARADLETGLAIAREVGHRRHEGAMLGSLARVLADLGETARAEAALQEAEALLRAIGDPYGVAGVLCVRGEAEFAAGRHDAARVTLQEAERLAQELGLEGDSGLGQELAQLRGRLGARV